MCYVYGQGNPIYSMKNLLQKYSDIVVFIIFSLALLILAIHFISLIYGFYFTGDTITFFVPAYPGHKGDLLAVFAWYYASFPPLVSFILNFFRFLPISFISQHHLYAIIFTTLSTISAYILTRQMTQDRKWQTVLVSVSLFTGAQSLLFLTALSEPIFILLWLLTIFFVERFMSTKKERFLLLFIASASLMPITRYLGLFVLISFAIILLLFTYFTFRQKKYSVPLIITSLALSFVPIFIVVIRNHIITQSFFGHFDKAFLPFQVLLIDTIKNAPASLLSDSRDLILFLIAGPIIGTRIKWNRPIKYLIILSGLPVLVYYFNLLLSMMLYRNEQALPLRYFALAFPILFLLTVCFGSFIKYRFPKFTIAYFLGLSLVVIILARELNYSFIRLTSEIKSPQSVITDGSNIHAGAENSADIRRFCRGKTKNKYLFLQESSRNWVAQSLNFYCQPIETISTKQSSIKLPKNSLIYSPYKITDPKIEPIEKYKGVKEVMLYKTTDETNLDIEIVTKKLQLLD